MRKIKLIEVELDDLEMPAGAKAPIFKGRTFIKNLLSAQGERGIPVNDILSRAEIAVELKKQEDSDVILLEDAQWDILIRCLDMFNFGTFHPKYVDLINMVKNAEKVSATPEKKTEEPPKE